MGGAGKDRKVKTTDTVFAIAETIKDSRKATITDIARETGFAKSTVHDHVSTLCEKEYLVREGDTYRIGLTFLEWGIIARNGVSISSVVRPTVDNVADETGEAVGVFVEEHGKRVYLDKAIGSQAIETHGNIGKRTHMHSNAAGKAILAYLPEERVDSILERHGMPALTDATITDRETLDEELERIRELKIGYNRHESVAGLHAVASPIVLNDQVHGAIGVAGPAHRMKGTYFEETLPEILLQATNEIELRLKSADDA